MDNDKSIFEKITDTVKDIANIAADAASHALKAEEPPLKAGQTAVAYMPLAGDGLVSDPLMVALISPAPRRKKKRAAAKPRKARAKKAVKKSAKRTVKKIARKTSKKTSKKASKRTSRKKKSSKRKASKKAAKGARGAKRSRR
jgi:hypothetical protein